MSSGDITREACSVASPVACFAPGATVALAAAAFLAAAFFAANILRAERVSIHTVTEFPTPEQQAKARTNRGPPAQNHPTTNHLSVPWKMAFLKEQEKSRPGNSTTQPTGRLFSLDLQARTAERNIRRHARTHSRTLLSRRLTLLSTLVSGGCGSSSVSESEVEGRPETP